MITCISNILRVIGCLLCGLPTALSAPQPARVPEAIYATPPENVPALPCQAGSAHCPLTLAQAPAGDSPTRIISDQIRRQGYACDEPRQAERDRKASRPNLTVWTLRCANATYRVTLIPDMAARVERLK